MGVVRVRAGADPPLPAARAGVQAGLCALKTPQSMGDDCSKEDPLHLPAFRKLAEGLPYAKHAHSKLICAISRWEAGRRWHSHASAVSVLPLSRLPDPPFMHTAGR